MPGSRSHSAASAGAAIFFASETTRYRWVHRSRSASLGMRVLTDKRNCMTIAGERRATCERDWTSQAMWIKVLVSYTGWQQRRPYLTVR